MNKSLKKKRFFELTGQSVDILSKIGVFFLALFLTSTRFIFGSYPFGFAILASTKKHTPFAFVGCLASVLLFMNASIVYLVAFIALLALRIAGSAWLGESKTKKSLGKETSNTIFDSFFSENVTVRVALSSLCIFVIGVLEVISNNYNYFYIFTLVFSTALVGILTYALSGLFKGTNSEGFLMGVCILSMMVVLSLAKKEIFGLDVSIILAYSLVIYTSKMLGGAKATMLGALLGLVLDFNLALCFAIMGAVSSLFWSFSYYFGIMCGALLSVGYGIFTSGYEAIVYLLPEAMLSSLVMYSLLRFELLPRISAKSSEASSLSINEAVLKERERLRLESIDSLSSSLSSLAELSHIGSMQSKVLSPEECRSLCLETIEDNCFSCPKRSICWEKETKETENNISSLAEGIFAKNEVTKSDVSERFLHRCPNIEMIISVLNDKKHSSLEATTRSDKLELCRQSYDAMSKMLLSLSNDKDTICDSALAEKLERALRKINLRFDSIEILGKRDKSIIITGVDTEGSKCSDSELKGELERILSVSLTEPKIVPNGSLSTIYLYTKEKYQIESNILTSPLDESMPNGDTCSELFAENGKYYMIICDGMGSGSLASKTSSLCVEFLKKLLPSTKRADHAISMLNTFIRAKGIECSSSVDIAEIDLYNAECSFIKSGACASFVKRGERVFCLSSKTAPLGIMKTPDAERLSLSLISGDIIVMLSDGIADDDSYEKITDAISSHTGSEGDLSKRLLALSSAKDDKTVAVLKFKEDKR